MKKLNMDDYIKIVDKFHLETIATMKRYTVVNNLHLGCNAGCANCCSMRVVAFVPEIFRINKYIREKYNKATIITLLNCLKEKEGLGNSLSDLEYFKKKIPCAFLDDKKNCLIYEVRPFTCIQFHSAHPALCVNGCGLQNIQLQNIAIEYGKKFFMEFFSQGYNCAPMEFQPALLASFINNAEKVWLNGEEGCHP